MKYLPSKKFIAGFLLVAAVIGGWFLYSKIFKNKKASSLAASVQVALENFSKTAGEKDSDTDGMKDWEEVLWGTDINNADTDGDGFSDKLEADAGFDPLDQLSNEKTGKKSEPKEFVMPDISVAINLTDEVAKTASMQIIRGMAQGSEPDISGALDFINQGTTLGLAEYIASLNVRLSEKEFKTTPDNSKESIENYYGQVKSVLYVNDSSVQSQISPDKIAVYIQSKDFSFFDKNIRGFEEAVQKMKNIIIPSDFLQIHKRITELLMSEVKFLESIKEIEKDPLKSLIGAQEGVKITEELSNTMVQFVNLVNKKTQ